MLSESEKIIKLPNQLNSRVENVNDLQLKIISKTKSTDLLLLLVTDLLRDLVNDL